MIGIVNFLYYNRLKVIIINTYIWLSETGIYCFEGNQNITKCKKKKKTLRATGQHSNFS